MQVFRQVPREGAHVDRLVVDDPMTLGGDPHLVEQRRHVADVAAPRGPDVVVHDEHLLRGLHERPGGLHLAREEGEVFRLQPERRRTAAHGLEGVVDLDEPAFLVVEERHPTHFCRHLSSPPRNGRSGWRGRPRRSRCPDRVPSPRGPRPPRASSPRRERIPCGTPARARRMRSASRSPRT